MSLKEDPESIRKGVKKVIGIIVGLLKDRVTASNEPKVKDYVQEARDQLKKELCEENWIVLRYVWYYEDPNIIIPEHLRELGLIC
ncbi:hypothetical protein Glove_186g182 [Diversispora epigaea]|uniref:Uncharacterized protein n=1 Tax=Diversispora epigaea TaxID=1348612 RepID=A0A397ILW0_9GLOM|nr:hypothetical protein Glove_372g14 [Diversispora epigaea]RHZ76999.1 hypothetical protein Glove_186g182 [Diversispora epigaea]